jgi:hypothetical protein
MTATVNASTSAGVVVTSDTSGSLALQTANTTALTISSAQVVNFANAPTVAGSPIGSSQATVTTLGTVYAKQTTGGGTPYLTAFGYNAGVSSTGTGNTAMGTQALYSDTTGYANTAIGYQASYLNITGSLNTFVGYQTGYTSNVNGAAGNTAVGYGAGYALTTGYYNCFFGVDGSVGGAGGSTTTGTNNAFFGGAAGFGNLSGSYNVAMGIQALQTNTTSSYNTALGYQAGQKITGQFNVAIGALSIQSATAYGNTNTGVGVYALTALAGGNGNSSLGYGALSAVNDGSGNIAIGYIAGNAITYGEHNLCLGYAAGANGTNLTTGNYNVLIGNNTHGSASGNSGELVIASGNNYAGKGSYTGYISADSGSIYQGSNSSSWSTTSDQRLKKNIVDNNVGLEKIAQIQVRNFEYRTEDEVTELPKNQVIKKEGVQLGVIAQELQAILPDCVKTESTGVMGLNTDNIMWHMINAIKELSAEVNALKLKVGV